MLKERCPVENYSRHWIYCQCHVYI